MERTQRTRTQRVPSELKKVLVTAWIGMAILAFCLLMAICAPLVAPFQKRPSWGGHTRPGVACFGRLPNEILGGEHRVCIARLLAANPDVIICDKVTSALDQIVQEGILQLLMRRQKEKNIFYLFITHDSAAVSAS